MDVWREARNVFGYIPRWKLPFVFMFALYTSTSYGILNGFNIYQPEPYMDEIFHIPQVQAYCEGNFSYWDPKITTLPGTYVVTSVILRMVDYISSAGDVCSTLKLRSFSLAVNFVNLFLIFIIIGHYTPEISTLKRVLSSLNIVTFPVLYFFSFLFYTDGVSTCSLLLMHYFYITKRYEISALAGAYSVFTRQTNIVWVFWHGSNTVFDILYEKYGDAIYSLRMDPKNVKLEENQASKDRKIKKQKKGRRNSETQSIQEQKLTPVTALPPPDQIFLECGETFVERGGLYMMIGFAFAGFVIYNGSIVVGDKEAHQATINIPQVGYFALVFGGFTAPFLLFRFKSVLNILFRQFPRIFMALVFASLCVEFNTVAHPYLLADNRHFTFYLWKRVFENACVPFVLVPIYVIVWIYIIANMTGPKYYTFTFFFCTALNVVPQLLLEFRYFIPAYLFVRMSFRNATWKELILEFFIYQIVNGLTLYAFFYMPFKWEGTEATQRFMW